ncbi:AprI/Inh family metalloprotease inhibitor [Microvirga terricola]|uniref:AprI/Inh family metalloprotease inhibitor n=1 Tax=Microvirga terricola TaxID=2719797 RepID=A0ABX0V695_9HYPH|nr:AprI/Inh family metalloprotease inhibitor [Microvirga terricola]NIX75253.1 AprI/Inh family metalloprotease inhibitor [Microvirga terricola]
MSLRVYTVAIVGVMALALGACSSSSRFGGSPFRSAQAAPVVPQQEPVEAVPSGPITAEPLPPIAGQPLPPVAGAPMSGSPGLQSGGTDLAALPPAAHAPVETPAAPAAPSSRTSMVGNWTARDAAGGSCRVQLSSAPALDLYRASSSGCSSTDLTKVNAWDYRDGEVYLYQQGGAVAARLRGSSSALSGVLAKSGAPLSLSR